MHMLGCSGQEHGGLPCRIAASNYNCVATPAEARFHFCGGLDAPDWLLAEISVLSRISSVRIKLLALQSVHSLHVSGKFDYA